MIPLWSALWSAATCRRFQKARRVAPDKAPSCRRTPKSKARIRPRNPKSKAVNGKAASCRRTPKDKHELAACSTALAL